MGKKSQKAKITPKKTIIISDAHGYFNEMSAVLIDSGYMNADLVWTGGKNNLLQIGDIVDRGLDAMQIDALLDTLQTQAKKAGGKVIRLVGNHEFEILKKNYAITNLPYFQIEPFRKKMVEMIAQDKLVAAHACNGFLITHAGICDSLYLELQREIKAPKLTASVIARHINKVFKEAVKNNIYVHKIFNITYLRGGPDFFGGIFWEDLSALNEHHKEVPFKQIVGHTRIPRLVASEDRKIIAVDIGMNKVFEGLFDYITINGKEKFSITRVGE